MATPGPLPVYVGSDSIPMILTKNIGDVRSDLLNAGAQNTTAIIQDANTNATTLLQDSCATTASVIASGERHADSIRANVDRVGYANGSAVERNFGETRGIMNSNFGAALLAAKDGESATWRAKGSINQHVSDVGCELGREINANGAQVTSQSERNFAETRGIMNGNFTAALLAAKDGEAATWRSKGNVTNKISEVGCEVGREMHTVGGELAAQADRIAIASGATAERVGVETRNILNSNFTASLLAAKDGELATVKTGGDIRHQTASQHGDIERSIATAREALGVQISATAAAGQLQVSATAAAGQLQAANLALQAQLQASNNTASIQLENAKNFAQSQIEIGKQFAIAALTAANNKSDLEKQMAECCCEIKQSVLTTASATQSLIQSTDASRIRDSLASANQENLILRLSGRCHDGGRGGHGGGRD
jgi:hypothetical protein